jgi:acetoin utilization deacetylase AcuC-like enzyme
VLREACALRQRTYTQRAKPATKREMTQFHSDEYIDFLSRINPGNMHSFVKEQGKCAQDATRVLHVVRSDGEQTTSATTARSLTACSTTARSLLAARWVGTAAPLRGASAEADRAV